MSTHKCQAKGCSIQVPNEELACTTHWRKLPWRMRTDLTHAYRAGDYQAHGEALAAAVQWYVTHDADTAGPSYGGHTTTTLDYGSSPSSFSSFDSGSSSGGGE